MKTVNLMSGILLMIGVASTLSITTSVQAAPEDSVYESWNKARDYMGYNTLQEEYQNVYNEYLKQQQEDDKLVEDFLERLMIKESENQENTLQISEKVATENIELEIEKLRKNFLKEFFDSYYK